VAIDGSGNVVVSTNPTGGPSAWTTTSVDGGENLTSISCPSTSLCVAGDGGQNVVTSTDPSGGASAWTVAHVDDGTGAQCGKYGDGDECVLGLTGVACPSQSLCVADDGEGNAITSTNPAGGATAWRTADIDGRLIGGADGLGGVTCPSASLCVTADGYGDHVPAAAFCAISGEPKSRPRPASPP
jgi:hypothetical protein